MRQTVKSYRNEADALQWLCSNKVSWLLHKKGRSQYWLEAEWPGGQFRRIFDALERPPEQSISEWVTFNKGAAVIDVQVRLSKQYADRHGPEWWRNARLVQTT